MGQGTEILPPVSLPGVDSVGSESAKSNNDGNLPASLSSSASSNSPAPMPDFISRPEQPSRSSTMSSTSISSSQTRIIPVDALSRQYPAPTHGASLEEMLARPPPRWSLGHYVKNAREARTPVPDKEQQAKEFADVKKELRAAKAQIKELALAGR